MVLHMWPEKSPHLIPKVRPNSVTGSVGKTWAQCGYISSKSRNYTRPVKRAIKQNQIVYVPGASSAEDSDCHSVNLAILCPSLAHCGSSGWNLWLMRVLSSGLMMVRLKRPCTFIGFPFVSSSLCKRPSVSSSMRSSANLDGLFMSRRVFKTRRRCSRACGPSQKLKPSWKLQVSVTRSCPTVQDFTKLL